MDSLQKLTTPTEYVNHYFGQFKNELNARGLQASKVGLIGYNLHVLGFTQSDVKSYYDFLFREAFLGTADKFENLTMHGSVYGYKPGFSQPARVVGNFELDLNNLPTDNVGSRTVFIEGLQIIQDSMKFTLDARYIIIGNVCQITDASGKVTNIPFSLANPKIPIIDLLQYEKQTVTFAAPFYLFGAYYSTILDLQNADQSICAVKVYVKESGTDIYTEYTTELVDYLTGPEEKTIFIKPLPGNKLLIDLGSGVHGKYIPNAQIRVEIKTTYGSKGNISKQDVIPQSGFFRVFENDTNTGQSLGSYTIDIGNSILAKMDYADAGADILDGEDLRKDIISYVRSRDNLMSETDFYDIINKYVPDFLLMFKKTHVVDNVTYCFLPFRDNYQLPIRSQSISVKHPEFNPDNACYVYKPTFQLNNTTYISPFLYVVDYNMRYYKGFIVYESVTTYFNKVTDEINKDNNKSTVSVPLTLMVKYNEQLNNTDFILQSYESIRDYVFYISIPLLGIDNICMTAIGGIASKYQYYDTEVGNGLIFKTIDISIKAYKGGVHVYTYDVENFSMVTDISDLLTLKSFEGFVIESELPILQASALDNLSVSQIFSSDTYILNIPVMRLDEYDNDSDYYTQKFANLFGIMITDHPRMMSDDVQMRFINTDLIPANIVKQSLKQGYNFDIKFPLHLNIQITAYKEMVNSLGINTIDSQFQLKLQLAKKLHDKYTGTAVSFYRTQIIDLVHDLTWVKHCNISVYDDTGIEIPNSDFEIQDQKQIIAGLDKLSAVGYTPMYVWWDLDNIVVNIIFE